MKIETPLIFHRFWYDYNLKYIKVINNFFVLYTFVREPMMLLNLYKVLSTVWVTCTSNICYYFFTYPFLPKITWDERKMKWTKLKVEHSWLDLNMFLLIWPLTTLPSGEMATLCTSFQFYYFLNAMERYFTVIFTEFMSKFRKAILNCSDAEAAEWLQLTHKHKSTNATVYFVMH